MSAKDGFTFGQYELRPATAEDADLAHEWTAADPAHAGIISPRFWLEQDRGVDCYLLSDAEGPLFFFRMQRAARLFIQFSPTATAQRTRQGLEEGMKWLNMALATVSVTEILFDSASKLLRRFVTGKLGFRPQPESLSKSVHLAIRRPIAPLAPEAMDYIRQQEEKALHSMSQQER